VGLRNQHAFLTVKRGACCILIFHQRIGMVVKGLMPPKTKLKFPDAQKPFDKTTLWSAKSYRPFNQCMCTTQKSNHLLIPNPASDNLTSFNEYLLPSNQCVLICFDSRILSYYFVPPYHHSPRAAMSQVRYLLDVNL